MIFITPVYHKKNKVSKKTKGITILLVLLITAALLAISTGIFDFIIIELKISGDLSDSFYAVYAADESMEKALYDDRIQSLYATPGVYTVPQTMLANGSCYTATITKTAALTTIKTVGKYQCGASVTRQLQRSLEVNYQ